MVRPFGKATAAAAAAAAGHASFADELFGDFNADLACHPPGGAASSTSAGDLQDDALLFRDFFGAGVDGLLELPAEGEDEEEEELEWLVNKDAFPGVETSFEVPTSSGGGGSGSRGSASAAGVTGERPSPISVLAAAGSSVPVKPRSTRRRMQRRVLTGLTPTPAAVAAVREEAPPEDRRRCRHCQTEETPQWRTGPEGPKTLCNACGVRYKSGRLVPEYRPASSPTFSANMHSNSHRRIMEMRRQKTATDIATPVCTSSRRRGAVPIPSSEHFP